jgi:DNA invertase Pin-like site-specific DNA recombinase
MKVVLLCRVSTDTQNYNRQVDELTAHCHSAGWDIMHVFANKVSGAKRLEERTEIMELIEYVEINSIDRVCVLSIDRLGRNTLAALELINLLNDRGICLYIKNYHLETITNGKVNPITSLICTILLEISQMERLTIMERMESGRKRYITQCRETGTKMGRPADYRKSDEAMKSQYAKDIQLLRKKMSLRNVSKITGTSPTTLRKLYKYL